MSYMPTQHLQLKKTPSGYYETRWTDDAGEQWKRSFGRTAATARAKFSTFHAEWKARHEVRNPNASVETLQAVFSDFMTAAKAYYVRRDGTPTGEAQNFKDAMTPALALYGEQSFHLFDLDALRATRAEMVKADLCVNTINARVRKIRQVIGWLVEHRKFNAAQWQSLRALKPIAVGRPVDVGNGVFMTPPATDDVKPVPDADVWAVVNTVPRTVAAMIQFGFWTGARPDETCSLRQCEIDMSGKIWLYRPTQHKTLHKNKTRIVPIGPRAQQVIQSLFTLDMQAHVFRPCDAWTQRHDMRVAAYQPADGMADYREHGSYKARAANRKGRGGDRYDARTYARTIARACKDLGIPHWSPNQLRHNAATRLRSQFDLDVAAAALGHSKADVTQIYAALDLKKAVMAMEAVG